MRTEILVVRHAEVHNPTDIVYGRLPRFRLSERGRTQSEMVARFLSARPVVAIYSSPLLRARQTAELLSRQFEDLPVQTTRKLIEVRTGYQGEPNSILKPGFSFYEPMKDPGDEPMLAVRGRMVNFLRRAIARHAGNVVVAVSHGDPIAIMRIALEGKELTAHSLHSTIYPARASITGIVVDPERSIELGYFDVVGDGPT